MLKRGADEKKLAIIIEALATDDPLPPQARPHMLAGDWKGYMECHTAPISLRHCRAASFGLS